jgi:hypothetical protein
VQVAAGASIAANATANGNGGRVTVLSSESTSMAGDISAMGGPQGGDGGLVETSGESLGVASSAVVDTSARAPTGTTGTWLLDPADITITNSATSGVSLAGGTFDPAASTSADTLSTNALAMALATGNVLVETICLSCTGPLLGSITVSDPVTWSSNATLTLHADNNIAINAAITGSGTGSGLILTAGLTTTTGSITLSAPISVNTFTALVLAVQSRSVMVQTQP